MVSMSVNPLVCASQLGSFLTPRRLPSAAPLSTNARLARRPVLRRNAESKDAAQNGIDGLLSKADALLEEVGMRMQEQGESAEDSVDETLPVPGQPQMTLHCDVNGCTIAPVASEAAASKGPRGVRLGLDDTSSSEIMAMEGKGWRLGYEKKPAVGNMYSAFVEGDSWSISLTPEEYEDFIQVLKSLRRSVATLKICGEWDTEGTAEATLELSTPRIWMQGRAAQRQLSILRRLWGSRGSSTETLPDVAFSLLFLVTSSGSREVEGYWPDEAVMEVLKQLDDGGPQAVKASDDSESRTSVGAE